jgi:hypothetical protein
MNAGTQDHPRWSTSAFGDSVLAPLIEWNALREHLELCRESRQRLGALRYAAERARGFVAARLVTTLVLMALITGLGSLLW